MTRRVFCILIKQWRVQMSKFTKAQTDKLDAMIDTMTDEQRQELTREGRRMEARKDEQAKLYMRKYRARVALAKRLGIGTGEKA